MVDAQPALRVALIAEMQALRSSLRRLLERNGVDVVMEEALGAWDAGEIGQAQADVLLVDLDDAKEKDLARLDLLIDQSPVPILFNMSEGLLDKDSAQTLMAKLNRLAKDRAGGVDPRIVAQEEAGRVFGAPAPRPKPNLRVISPAAPPPEAAVSEVEPTGPEAVAETQAVRPAESVWVLAGSLGGPQAVKRFLARIPADLPVSFVVAQHIGVSHVPLLTRQLERVSPFQVQAVRHGEVLEDNRVLVASGKERFSISESGVMELLPERRSSHFNPSIDTVMGGVAQRFGVRSGAIVFSGMGMDGAGGSSEIVRLGGQVWAQDAESCVMSTMPDAVRRRGVASYSGSPEELAERLVGHINQIQDSR